jgi:hypothetical protein
MHDSPPFQERVQAGLPPPAQTVELGDNESIIAVRLTPDLERGSVAQTLGGLSRRRCLSVPVSTAGGALGPKRLEQAKNRVRMQSTYPSTLRPGRHGEPCPIPASSAMSQFPQNATAAHRTDGFRPKEKARCQVPGVIFRRPERDLDLGGRV